MQDSLQKKLRLLWGINQEFKLKVFLLSLTFLLMSACLVIWRPLKVSIFAKMVGACYVPTAKLISLCFLIPLILLYSKLVDWLRRHHLLYFFTIGHAIGGLIFYFLFSHPVHGIANTATAPDRWVGWAFYFFMESFDAFFATSFWSFADSVNNPKDARNYYGFFVTGSKLGGILAAGCLYSIISFTSIESQILLPRALFMGSIILLSAAYSIYTLIRKVPESKMHGYESVYKLEKTKNTEKTSIWASLKGSFEGLLITIKNPYVLGIFSLVFFYEIVIVVFDYLVMIQADAAHKTVGSLTGFYAFYYLIMNTIGLMISLFGTTPILRILGLRLSLFAYPVATLLLLITAAFFPCSWVLIGTLIGLRALNYALNHPTREVLYIPTVKSIKFKAKTWTDAFGSRLAKSTGSLFNLKMNAFSSSIAVFASTGLSIGLTMLCLIVTYFLGKRFQHAVETKSVIGSSAEETGQLEEIEEL